MAGEIETFSRDLEARIFCEEVQEKYGITFDKDNIPFRNLIDASMNDDVQVNALYPLRGFSKLSSTAGGALISMFLDGELYVYFLEDPQPKADNSGYSENNYGYCVGLTEMDLLPGYSTLYKFIPINLETEFYFL